MSGMTAVGFLHHLLCHFLFGTCKRFFLHSAKLCAPGVSEVAVLSGQQISSAKPYAAVLFLA
jgi:hypothetical protein